jgi:hypothetical protein
MKLADLQTADKGHSEVKVGQSHITDVYLLMVDWLETHQS